MVRGVKMLGRVMVGMPLFFFWCSPCSLDGDGIARYNKGATKQRMKTHNYLYLKNGKTCARRCAHDESA